MLEKGRKPFKKFPFLRKFPIHRERERAFKAIFTDINDR
jgi:hypothetical protein